MSDFNGLKPKFLSRISGVNNLSELREITRTASDEFRDAAWSKPNRERARKIREIKEAHEKSRAERRKDHYR